MTKGHAGGSKEYFTFLSEVAQAVAQHVGGATPPPGPSSEFSRRAFEIGSSNELAVRAGDAVVSDPARRFNPLFVHGPTGIGKTHLLHAIGAGLLATLHQQSGVACMGAQSLIDEWADASRNGGALRWQQRYASTTALLIDDVHLFAKKELASQALCTLLNDRYAAGKQIVLMSGGPPDAVPHVDAWLQSCPPGGLVVEIGALDCELREKLFARYLLATSAERDPTLARYLATRPVASAPEVLALVNRLAAAADAAGTHLTLHVARAELEGSGEEEPPRALASEPQLDAYFLDAERVIWEWPEPAGRVIEEWR